MRVICINAGIVEGFDAPELKEGEIYTVIGFLGDIGYYLEEVSSVGGPFYIQRFSPLSEIDETTFERNYNLQTV